ncbi:MAG: FAD-dependent oxidoreductase [Parcubacteria group bacterium]|nr:FAD-dependent oxidoreductase [Parcubacteria group bacterium]
MSWRRVKLLDKKEVAQDTWAFFWEKPADFSVKAGQFIKISIALDGEKNLENTRSMSLASAPFEPYLISVMRMTGSFFKQALRDLKIGDFVDIRGPLGRLLLAEETDKPRAAGIAYGDARLVFLAGGIGVVPFRSMVLEEEKKGFPHEIYLFYSAREINQAPFWDDLRNIRNPRYHFIGTVTGSADRGWQGERGRIDEAMLSRHLKNLSEPIYYIVGLEDMVKSLKEQLQRLGLPPDQVRIESFGKYPHS